MVFIDYHCNNDNHQKDSRYVDNLGRTRGKVLVNGVITPIVVFPPLWITCSYNVLIKLE